MTKPLAIDLYCGLGGWTEGLLAAGYNVVGFDIERHEYDGERYPAQLVIQDVLTLHGRQFKDAALIVASPPCQFFSYTAMPWSKAKALAAEVRACPVKAAERLALFNACFRIQREASEAAGHHIPLVVENVRGATPWVGRAAFNYGSFYIWGDVPALMPAPMKAVKAPGLGHGWKHPDDPRHTPGLDFTRLAGQTAMQRRSFQSESAARHVEGVKNPGRSLERGAPRFNDRKANFNAAEGRKGAGAGADWFDQNLCQLPSKSSARKAASARIAKIPFALSHWIGRAWFPVEA